MENPAEFASTTLQILLCIVLVVVAIRTYRMRRTRGLRLLLYASICYALVRFGWFTYDLAIYLFSLPLIQSSASVLHEWKLYSGRALHIGFLLLMILSLRSFRRDVASTTTQPSNQALQPTAGRSAARLKDEL
jgi:hypothetical protein